MPGTIPYVPSEASRITIASKRIAKIDAALGGIHEIVMEATNGERGDMWGYFNNLKAQAVGIKAMLVR